MQCKGRLREPRFSNSLEVYWDGTDILVATVGRALSQPRWFLSGVAPSVMTNVTEHGK
jgi:hypothetical protein